jgi:hypothetical protein
VHVAAERAHCPELRGVGGGSCSCRLGGVTSTRSVEADRRRGAAGRIREDGVRIVDEAERHLAARVRIPRAEDERQAAEGAGDGGLFGADSGGQLKDGERVGLAGGESRLGGEEDVGDGEELVGPREERLGLQGALREPLAADEIARGEELLRDLQPPPRLRATAAGGAGGEVHGIWGKWERRALPVCFLLCR